MPCKNTNIFCKFVSLNYDINNLIGSIPIQTIPQSEIILKNIFDVFMQRVGSNKGTSGLNGMFIYPYRK